MPIHEYRYTNYEGQTKTVERLFKMGKAPKTITVEEGDEVYTAERIMSAPANTTSLWRADSGHGLPAPDHPFIP